MNSDFLHSLSCAHPARSSPSLSVYSPTSSRGKKSSRKAKKSRKMTNKKHSKRRGEKRREESQKSSGKVKLNKECGKTKTTSKMQIMEKESSKGPPSKTDVMKITKETFMLRWSHAGPPPLLTTDHGTTVRAMEYLKSLETEHWEGKNMVKCYKKENGKKIEGFISAIYLEYVGDDSSCQLVQDILSVQKLPKLMHGRWFFGRVPPVECAIWLCNRSYLPRGSFLVCQPSFLWPSKKEEWPRYLLVVRIIGGCIEWFHHSWLMDENHNIRASTGMEGFNRRPTVNDSLPPPPNEPPAAIAYYIIQRTSQGRYYIEDQNKSFYLIPELLEHHMNNPLTFCDGRGLTLKEYEMPLSPHVNGESVEPLSFNRCPAPPPVPNCIFKYSGKDVLPDLIAYPNTHISKYPIRVHKETMGFKGGSPSGTLQKGYIRFDSNWTPITLRRMDKKRRSTEGLGHDINLLDPKMREKNKAVKDRKRLHMNGYEYIAHIMAGDMVDKSFGPWVAYEFVEGIPLNDMLDLRKESDEVITLRSRYQIMGQIAAGMRFLESNHLCHRHLTSKNIIVMMESYHLLRIKITDYMLPYHFLNEANVKYVNLLEMSQDPGKCFLWWAPECIKERQFDIEQDVWAFGCVMFEIMNDGATPYSFEKPSINKLQELKIFYEVKGKMKLAEDDVMETFVHDLMGRCMSYNKKSRPSFTVLNQFFTELLLNTKLNPMTTIQKCLNGKEDMAGTTHTTF